MRALLRKLNIREGADLAAVITRAWQVPLVRFLTDTPYVTRAALLNATLWVNPRVFEVLLQAGLIREKWDTLFVGDNPLPQDPPEVPQYDVSPDPLVWYAREMSGRHLDSAGLAIAILETADEALRLLLNEAGVDVDKARSEARTILIGPDTGTSLARIDHDFALRPQARRLLEEAAKTIVAEQIGVSGITTSTFLITLLTTNTVPPDTSPRFLQDHIRGTAGAGRMTTVIRQWTEWYGTRTEEPTRSDVTPAMLALLQQARAIAHQVGGTDSEIHIRHLAGAVLTLPESGALALLSDLRVDLPSLKRDYFTWLEEQAVRFGENDDTEEWRRVLGVPADQRWMPRFDAEGFGDDLLNTRRDVNAFAALLAAKNLTPPLSVGLFGDWGSGKSFFMSMLKAQIERNSHRDKETFYERIIQIDFNAWHYVEADLWASLVEHIFRNLSLAGEKPLDAENRRNALLSQLNETVAAEAIAKENVRRAENERDLVATNLAATKASVAEDAATLRDLRARDVWEIATIDEADRDELRHALNEAGLGQAITSTNELRGTFDQLQRIGDRTRLLWLTIVRKPWAWIGLLAVALLAPIAGSVLADFLRTFNLTDEKRAIAAAVVRATTVITAFTLWLTPLMRGARKVLRRIDVAKGKVERRLHEAERRRQAQVDEQTQKLDDATHAVTQAQADLIQKESAVLRARKALLDISAGQQLARFIDDRAASDDYRKLLGVLATVRGDFEKLSKLMHGQSGERMEGDLFRIDRIILYIDDLDRCHPDRVVDVLQAVHLLLAFPLFVVVVGVDARWVEESLRQKHRAFREGAVPGYAVAPHDYLEKIFQVPFWLEPISSGGGARFIERLLAAEVEEVATEEVQPAAPREQTVSHVIHTATHTIQLRTTAKTEPVVDEPTPPLKLQRKERDVMKQLAPLVGRSPRTVKRFVNTYRIIRAGVPARRIDALLEENPVGDYKAILLLLAIVVGVPTISVELFAAIRDAESDTTAEAFAESLEDSGEWKKVSSAITAIAKSTGGRMTIAHLREHLDNVGRYSFRRAAA
jgi:hypothetical protein